MRRPSHLTRSFGGKQKPVVVLELELVLVAVLVLLLTISQL